MRTLLALALVACSSDPAPFECGIGTLTGTWRTVHVEEGGTCGAIPDSTTTFTPGVVAPGCVQAAFAVSSDRCRVEDDSTCETTDKRGSQRWVGVLRQTAEGKLEGSYTLELTHSSGVCRSTYSITHTRL